MSKELIVSAGRHETRVAILEDDQVVELFHEREKEYSLAGSIHKGRVTRVLPGMQSAFVDIGLERDAFLYVSDFFEDNDEYDAVVSTVEEKIFKMDRGGSPLPVERTALPSASAVAAAATTVDGIVAPQRTEDPSRSGRPERSPENRGEQGGRGRRGRRRRGTRPGGLPDSKFFTPRADGEPAEQQAEGETDDAAAEETQPEIQAAEPAQMAPLVAQFAAQYGLPAARTPSSYYSYVPPAGEGILVLPGESLAKYSAEEASPQAPEPPLAVLSTEEHVEAALPGDHPLAAFGSNAATWTEPVTEAVLEPEVAAEPAPEAVLVAIEEPAVPVPQMEAEPAPPVIAVVDEPAPLDADELAEVEEAAAEAAAEAEGSPSVGEPLESAAVDSEAAEPATGELSAASENTDGEVAEGDAAPENGSATVREPNQRFPHRVSRRNRRNRRPGDKPERTGNPPAIATGEAGEQVVELPATGQPERTNDRPERSNDRGGDRNRDRGERTERTDRPERPERTERPERPERERPPLPSIADLLKEGQEIVVQIAKEPIGQKGARITSHIALPGRFVVYMPTVEHVGVSRKIPSDEERHRLKRVLQTHRQGVPGGFICRTAAEGKTEEELRVDMHFLYNLWLDMRQKAEKKPAPVLLHHDLDLVQRILRDQLTTSFKTIWVDNEELYTSVMLFVERFQPALIGRVKLYTRSNPIFDEFGITAEVEKALRPKVWLKSGGYIVINQTEALVAIDINTGKYVGKSNRLEDTIVKINTDAIKEIVRQIRLRDLGGIIVVDFIDMDERKNRQKVMLALEEGMRADRAPYKILQFNDFGLVAITRKRVKQSLERTLCSPCSYCEGAGYLKSPSTVISEILQEAQRMQKALASETGNVILRVNPEVARILKSNSNSFLQEIEEIAGRTVMVKSDPLLHQTKFDLA